MRKSVFLFILLLSVLHLAAQQRSQIQLTSSQKVKGTGADAAARFIRPVFTHEGSTLAADSADYNQAANAFDAYGHVVITQPDGTVIYSDILNYDGNTRIAILTNNVKMVDKDATLTTQHLTYNMATKIGTYIGGGKIENAQNVLTSQNGYYFANTRDAYFRYNVVVNTPDALIKTDTLKYNTESKIAWFFGPTTIDGKGKNKQSKLYTENGRYNTLTDQAWFGKNNLYTEDSKSLKGDSLYYDGKAGFGKAINNITFLDTVQKVILKGNQGIYRKSDESALVTRNAYVVIEAEQDSGKVDSIWMTADTLRTKLIPMREFISATKEELKADKDVSTDPVVEGDGIIVGPDLAPPASAAPAAAPERSGKGRKKLKASDRKKQEQELPPPGSGVNTGPALNKDSTASNPDSVKSEVSVKTTGAVTGADSVQSGAAVKDRGAAVGSDSLKSGAVSKKAGSGGNRTTVKAADPAGKAASGKAVSSPGKAADSASVNQPADAVIVPSDLALTDSAVTSRTANAASARTAVTDSSNSVSARDKDQSAAKTSGKAAAKTLAKASAGSSPKPAVKQAAASPRKAPGLASADSVKRLTDTVKTGVAGKSITSGTAKGDSLLRDSLKTKAAPPDSAALTPAVRATVKGADSLAGKNGSALKDSVRAGKARDSVNAKGLNPQDTAKTRVIYAYHKVKIFKSDLQSRSDSAFYSYADSIIRCYRNPIIWTQGTQLTGDTIYLQMKNRKLDNMLLQHNAFIVTAEGDSTKFDQVKGKVVTGVFVDSKLKSMYVDGNAESIYYSTEDSAITGVNRSLSSRMRLEFSDNKLQKVMLVRKPEGKFYPIEKVPEDIEVLPGFIWKPKDRPKSKEEIIPEPKKGSGSAGKKARSTAAKKTGTAAGARTPAVSGAKKPDTSARKAAAATAGKDSLTTQPAKAAPPAKDTTGGVLPAKQDSLRRPQAGTDSTATTGR